MCGPTWDQTGGSRIKARRVVYSMAISLLECSCEPNAVASACGMAGCERMSGDC